MKKQKRFPLVFPIAALFLTASVVSPGVLNAYAAFESEFLDGLEISLFVFGPSDPVYGWFGHIGVILNAEEEDLDRLLEEEGFRPMGTDRLMFDYGRFSFEEGFYASFFQGKLLYWKSMQPLDFYLSYVMEMNIDIVELKLDLNRERKSRFVSLLLDEVRPGNNQYYYEFYLDNCSTRVRDVLDQAIGGDLLGMTDSPSEHTYRSLMRRHTYHSPLMDLFINYLVGREADMDIRKWDEMYLPQRVEHYLNRLEIDGKPIISERIVWNEAVNRYAIQGREPPRWPAALLFGLLLAAPFAALRLLAERRNRRWIAVSYISLQMAVALIGGILSAALYFFVLFSNHQITKFNLDLLVATPALFAVIPMGILLLFSKNGKERRRRRIQRIWRAHLLMTAVLPLLWLLPPIKQMNIMSLLLVAPMLMVLSFGSRKEY